MPSPPYLPILAALLSMVFKRIAAVLLWLLVSLTSAFGFMASEPKTAPGDFFLGTVEDAGENGPSAREQCRINGWLNYDTASGCTVAANNALFHRGMGVEKASAELLEAVGQRRAITFAEEGSDALRFLDMRGAEAAAFGEADILLRTNPSRAAVLEEFLHGTQQRLGIIDRLGREGAERHVKEFMIRNRNMLGLGDEDVKLLQELMEQGL